MTGLLLALQFFTAIPVTKELSMERKDVTRMYIAFPIIGALIGLIMYAVAFLFMDAIGTGPLLTSFAIVLTGIALTGGLHMDGFADLGDGYFSYRDKEKRLDIMDDPRIGAFGTMALVLLIIGKLALVHELLLREVNMLPILIVAPVLARIGMNVYFVATRLAKEKGIAHFFKEKIDTVKLIGWSLFTGVMALVLFGYIMESVVVPVVLAIFVVLAVVLFRRWSLKQFGGVSGDLCGAFIEGTEALVWLIIIICI
ncbi:adenosylcobinamide-GDP ribazoletransferase [Sporosarcina sp. Sa2YVA2]|uniref:Adenosylcobinamide-GDP ribazoletransferase n=1 Tax=Sporosarcina quadrami TaxID=2762234 RepID=A0ABR8U9G1_9BACL|nr:adenosylcobinamide-GDP ribazoletransferase [Sporosarcina quadrami]MBD7984677.1 adenosylcobinamide-GDP ribazoletransferase [Sporosarcina quadrami]